MADTDNLASLLTLGNTLHKRLDRMLVIHLLRKLGRL